VASRERGPDRRGAPGLDSHSWPGTDSQTAHAEPESVAGRRRPEDVPPRAPGQYALTDHFRERLAQGGRYLSLPAVGDAIRYGQLRWNATDGWRFALVNEGVRLVVVVCDTETPSPVVVTAWTELADREAALASDRWTFTDVETIELRSALAERPDEHVPQWIRPRDVDQPFRLGAHRITTAPGVSHVQCVDCGGRYRSKTDLERGHCHG
jgi:hypothetical protein